MAFERKSLILRGDAPGWATEFTWYSVGPADAAEKVHLQAALHADEHPGTMVLHHLLPLLRAADDRGLLRARFTVMPVVNPLGMQSFSFDRHLGRFDPRSGVNHNRRWPDLFSAVRTHVVGRLNEDLRFNVNLIRKSVAQWIDSQQPRTPADASRGRRGPRRRGGAGPGSARPTTRSSCSISIATARR
jgi:predicted deacylase